MHTIHGFKYSCLILIIYKYFKEENTSLVANILKANVLIALLLNFILNKSKILRGITTPDKSRPVGNSHRISSHSSYYQNWSLTTGHSSVLPVFSGS